MNQRVVRGILTSLVCLTATVTACGQDGKAPRGYLFFAHRNRPAATPQERAAAQEATKARQRREAACCGLVDSGDKAKVSPVQAVAPTQVVTPAQVPGTEAATSAQSEVRQVDWGGAEFGIGTGYTNEGYYPGQRGYAFGRQQRFPLHGYRPQYDWAGHTYEMHCYCDGGYPPFQCPGYRGACFVPCWNDNGTQIFERKCGRGSYLDCFWHMGGYECPRRKTDCPYVCGTPAYASYGFPRGRSGDPNFHPPGKGPQKPMMEPYSDEFPPSPEKTILPIPEDYRERPREPDNTPAPVPNPPQ
jgi:hypothetical protein